MEKISIDLNCLEGPNTPAMNLARKIFKGQATEQERTEYLKKYASQGEKELGKCYGEFTYVEYVRCNVINDNYKEGNLSGGDCRYCRNKGYILGVDDNGYEYYKECECMQTRRVGKVENSEYIDYITSKTFENFETKDDAHRTALFKCKRFITQKKLPFLFIGGSTGTGKTHLTTATFYKLVLHGYDNYYAKWESEYSALTSERTSDTVAYRKRLNRLKYSQLLLIDDLLWRADKQPTDGEFRLIKEILDERATRNLKTLMSSNYTLERLFNFNAVVGGRINEFAGGEQNFALTLNGENYRKRELTPWGDIDGF